MIKILELYRGKESTENRRRKAKIKQGIVNIICQAGLGLKIAQYKIWNMKF